MKRELEIDVPSHASSSSSPPTKRQKTDDEDVFNKYIVRASPCRQQMQEMFDNLQAQNMEPLHRLGRVFNRYNHDDPNLILALMREQYDPRKREQDRVPTWELACYMMYACARFPNQPVDSLALYLRWLFPECNIITNKQERNAFVQRYMPNMRGAIGLVDNNVKWVAGGHRLSLKIAHQPGELYLSPPLNTNFSDSLWAMLALVPGAVWGARGIEQSQIMVRLVRMRRVGQDAEDRRDPNASGMDEIDFFPILQAQLDRDDIYSIKILEGDLNRRQHNVPNRELVWFFYVQDLNTPQKPAFYATLKEAKEAGPHAHTDQDIEIMRTLERIDI